MDEKDREAIESSLRACLAEVRPDGDMARYAAVFAPGAVGYGPQGEPIENMDNVDVGRRVLEEACFKHGVVKMEVVRVYDCGLLAPGVAYHSSFIHGTDRTGRLLQRWKDFNIWTKQADGSWKIIRDVFAHI